MLERFDVRQWLPALWVGSLLMVVLASLWPEGSRVDEAIGSVWWNIGHVPVYGVLTLLTLLAAAQRFPLTPVRLFWLAMGVGLFGALMEVLQPYFGRTADVGDALSNLMGILLALVIFYLSRWWQGVRPRAN